MNKVKKISEDSIPAEYSFKNATGPIRYNLTNDYMFRKALSTTKFALKGLIASLLYTEPENIESLVIKNPVIQGETIGDKECRMDILVKVNGKYLMDLEMQVKDEGNWVERTLIYECRLCDDLKSGENYKDINSIFSIGFLNFPLFEGHNEFYSQYGITNLKDGFPFTDKFRISVVELNQTELATKTDKVYNLDKWAKLFTATTWEEVKMIANDNEYLESLAEAMHKLSLDPITVKYLREREDIIRYNQAREDRIAEQEAQISEQAAEIERLKKLLEEKNSK